MNILAISGSLREASANTAILRGISTLMPAGVGYEIWQGLGGLPHFSPDIDFDASPASVMAYREQLRGSDAVIICTPEYAFGMPGVLKNALDWVVSSGEFDRKPVATISASPLPGAGEKAHAWLNQTLSALGAWQVEGAKLSVPAMKSKMDSNAVLTDPALIADLKHLVEILVAATRQ